MPDLACECEVYLSLLLRVEALRSLRRIQLPNVGCIINPNIRAVRYLHILQPQGRVEIISLQGIHYIHSSLQCPKSIVQCSRLVIYPSQKENQRHIDYQIMNHDTHLPFSARFLKFPSTRTQYFIRCWTV